MSDSLTEHLESPEIKRKPLRIIYVEDQEMVGNFIKKELKKFPADIELIAFFESTEDAEEYLMRLKNENNDLPDAIVSDDDLGAGKRKGVQFAKDLQEQGFKTPFVLFTSDMRGFKSLSEERLSEMGLITVVDKLESTALLVDVLKGINSSLNRS